MKLFYTFEPGITELDDITDYVKQQVILFELTTYKDDESLEVWIRVYEATDNSYAATPEWQIEQANISIINQAFETDPPVEDKVWRVIEIEKKYLSLNEDTVINTPLFDGTFKSDTHRTYVCWKMKEMGIAELARGQGT